MSIINFKSSGFRLFVLRLIISTKSKIKRKIETVAYGKLLSPALNKLSANRDERLTYTCQAVQTYEDFFAHFVCNVIYKTTSFVLLRPEKIVHFFLSNGSIIFYGPYIAMLKNLYCFSCEDTREKLLLFQRKEPFSIFYVII